MGKPMEYVDPDTGKPWFREHPPVESVPVQPEDKQGWIPYRGEELHGVQPAEGIDMPEDSWEDDVKADGQRPPRVRLRDQDPLPVVIMPGNDPVTQTRTRFRMVQVYPTNGIRWVEILPQNDQRVAAYITFMGRGAAGAPSDGDVLITEDDTRLQAHAAVITPAFIGVKLSGMDRLWAALSELASNTEAPLYLGIMEEYKVSV